MTGRVCAALALGLLARPLLGQAPAGPPTFVATTELVKVDVVVLDEQGRPIRGLTAADFTVAEDGHLQPITVFEAVDDGVEEHEPPSAAAAAPVATRPTRAPRRAEVVMVFDELHLTPGGMEQVRRELAAAFDADSLGPADVALLSTAVSGTWRGRLPEDRDALIAALRRFKGTRPQSQSGRLSDQEAFLIAARRDDRVLTEAFRRYLDQGLLLDPTIPALQQGLMRGQRSDAQASLPEMGRSLVRVEAEMLWGEVRVRQLATLRGLVELLDALATRPGRKAVVLLSEGFIYDHTLSEHRELVAAARLAQASVHLVDPRSANRVFWHDAEVSDWVDSRDSAQALDRAFKDAEGAEAAAAGTGGQVLRQLPALPRALGRIGSELRSYYLLGYAPPSPPDDGRYHALSVKVARSGVRLQARPGYYALAPRPAPGSPRGPEAALAAALEAGGETSALPLRLAAFVLGPARQGQTLLRLVAELDTGARTGTEADGLLQLVARSRRETQRWVGHAVSRRAQPGRLRLEAQFTVPPGAYQAQAVLALRDSPANGSARQALEVLPDQAFRLTTPILTDEIEGQTPVLRAERAFRAGGTLHCLVEVLGASTSGPVLAGVQLLGPDGRIWRDVRPSPLSTARRSRLWSLPLTDLPPGPYSLSISVLDEGTRQGLQQRESFEIVAPAGS